MRRLMRLVVIAVVVLVANVGWAASCFEVMEEVQTRISWQVWNADGWAANPVVVEAVLAQNAKGPIPGMDNAKWKTVPESDAIVQGFIKNEAAKFLKAEMANTDGICTGAFLNAAQGEKVASPTRPAATSAKGPRSSMCLSPAARAGRANRSWMTAARSTRSRSRFPSSPRGSRSGYWWSSSTEQSWKNSPRSEWLTDARPSQAGRRSSTPRRLSA